MRAVRSGATEFNTRNSRNIFMQHIATTRYLVPGIHNCALRQTGQVPAGEVIYPKHCLVHALTGYVLVDMPLQFRSKGSPG